MDRNKKLIRRLGNRKYRILQTSNFSDVESSPMAKRILKKLAAEAGRAAASEARAIGLPRVFAKGDVVIREFPDGRREIIAQRKTKEGYFIHKKLGVLHARAK